jgi:Protein of unknown function (DUF3592)
MGGWFVDVYVEYLVRTILLLVKRLRTRGWQVTDARVTDSSCLRADYGCHVADAQYDYAIDGAEYSGIHEKPFIFLASGEAYARRLSSGLTIQVKYDAKEPTNSFLVNKGSR